LFPKPQSSSEDYDRQQNQKKRPAKKAKTRRKSKGRNKKKADNPNQKSSKGSLVRKTNENGKSFSNRLLTGIERMLSAKIK